MLGWRRFVMLNFRFSGNVSLRRSEWTIVGQRTRGRFDYILRYTGFKSCSAFPTAHG
ncbi:unnamed protein product [Soboliphyme baturini]|uniref:Uncharacterized protein n=1 Tax=Soboliphyme baturini TaxID=241478 RepID=A0A183J075_9BILA|nr:unnamed protein product [Soboliphyme baturini]